MRHNINPSRLRHNLVELSGVERPSQILLRTGRAVVARFASPRVESVVGHGQSKGSNTGAA